MSFLKEKKPMLKPLLMSERLTRNLLVSDDARFRVSPDDQFIVRVMRMLNSMGMVKEVGPQKWTCTSRTASYADSDANSGGIVHLYGLLATSVCPHLSDCLAAATSPRRLQNFQLTCIIHDSKILPTFPMDPGNMHTRRIEDPYGNG